MGAPEGTVGPGASSSSSPTFGGIAFQQGTLQPFRLRKDTFGGLRTEFDVISTSNLAEHLGKQSVMCDYGDMNARYLTLSVDTENHCSRIKGGVHPVRLHMLRSMRGTRAAPIRENRDVFCVHERIYVYQRSFWALVRHAAAGAVSMFGR